MNENYPTTKKSTTQSTTQSRGYSDQLTQAKLVDWFYLRLSNIYGTRFKTQFRSDPDITASKIEWGEMINEAGAEKLHRMLERVKREQSINTDLAWPNIGYILGLKTGASPTGINSDAYIEYSAEPCTLSSPSTASAYMSVMRHCLGDDAKLPEGYAGSAPMDANEAAAYVRDHIGKTKRKPKRGETPEYSAELDQHYLNSCKETEQMMQEHGL